MSGKVIPFRVSPAQAVREGRGRIDPQLVEERNRAFDRKRLSEIRAGYKSKSGPKLCRWGTEENRLRAAQALGKLVQADGMSLAELKKRWRDEHHQSELHIHRYMLPPSTDLTNHQTLLSVAKTITTDKVEPYADRARFIAQQKGLDVDQSEISLFRNTSLWRKQAATTSTDNGSAEAAEEVALQIQNLCDGLTKDMRLAELFKKMRYSGGRWDTQKEVFRPDTTMCLLPPDFPEYPFYPPPYPSVPLVLLRHEVLKFRAHVSSAQTSEPIALSAPTESANDAAECEVELHIHRQIRLGIGLTMNENTIGPLFESRLYSTARLVSKGVEGPVELDFGLYLCDLGPERPFKVLLDAGQYQIRPLVELQQFDSPLDEPGWGPTPPTKSPFCWPFDPLTDDYDLPNGWFSWTAVDAEHVKLWLDEYPVGTGSCPVNELAHMTEAAPVDDETWFPEPLLAHYVERALNDGRLRSALESAVKRLEAAFAAHDSERRARLEEKTHDFIADCRNDLPPF